MKKSFALIPARHGSKGIKNKNLQFLNDLNLLEISILAALQSNIFSKIYISSNGKDIINCAKDIAYHTKSEKIIEIIWRPEEISSDYSTTEQAISHFINYANSEIYKDDLIYLLQPTSPFRNNGLIYNFHNKFLNSGCKTGFTGTKTTPFLWFKNKPCYDIKNRKMRQSYAEDEFYYHEDGNIYVFTKSVFEKNQNRIDENPFIYGIEDIRSIQIDTINDLNYCRYLCEKDNSIILWNKTLVNLLQK